MTYKEWAAKNKNNGAITCDEAYKAGAASRDAEIARLVSAIDEEMVTSHLGVFNQGDDPRKAINNLMSWAQSVGEFFANDKKDSEIAELVAALDAMHNDSEEYLYEDECTVMLVPMDNWQGVFVALAKVSARSK